MRNPILIFILAFLLQACNENDSPPNLQFNDLINYKVEVRKETGTARVLILEYNNQNESRIQEENPSLPFIINYKDITPPYKAYLFVSTPSDMLGSIKITIYNNDQVIVTANIIRRSWYEFEKTLN